MWMGIQNLLNGSSSSQVLQNVLDSDACPSNNRLAHHNIWVQDDLWLWHICLFVIH